ncbi:MAG: guanylate kinase [Acidobacteriota bacterium]|jgi:guanylate kinase
MVPPGELFIVSSPSGGGKTTIIRGVMEELRRQGRAAYFSVSHTTRPPREGERDGVDYHFVERSEFRRMVERREFLEYAEVHGNLYGTSRGEVEGRLESGCDVFLDIDVQGARQVRAFLPAAVKVFIFPPSCAELRRRLLARRQDSPEVIELRIRNALKEMREYAEFDYVIINDRLEQAIRDLAQVVATSRLRPRAMQTLVQPIIDSFASELEEE